MISRNEYFQLQIKARQQTRKQIASGDIPRLDGTVKCVDCNEVATCYDHRDYNKPKEVEPVCTKCNSKRGMALPEYDGFQQRAWNRYDGIQNEYTPDDCGLSVDFDFNAYDLHCYNTFPQDTEVSAFYDEMQKIKKVYS